MDNVFILILSLTIIFILLIFIPKYVNYRSLPDDIILYEILPYIYINNIKGNKSKNLSGSFLTS